MTGMPARDVSVLPVMNRNSVTGAAPVWSRAIARNGVMLMKVLIITNPINASLSEVQKASENPRFSGRLFYIQRKHFFYHFVFTGQIKSS